MRIVNVPANAANGHLMSFGGTKGALGQRITMCAPLTALGRPGDYATIGA
jgi:hypothetical protein